MAKLCLACMFVCANICLSNGALITHNLLSASFFWQCMSTEPVHVLVFSSVFFFCLIRELSWWRISVIRVILGSVFSYCLLPHLLTNNSFVKRQAENLLCGFIIHAMSVCDSCLQPFDKGMTFLNITPWIREACQVSWPSECSLAMWHSVVTSRQSDSLRY